jgi:hypothetical protein
MLLAVRVVFGASHGTEDRWKKAEGLVGFGLSKSLPVGVVVPAAKEEWEEGVLLIKNEKLRMNPHPKASCLKVRTTFGEHTYHHPTPSPHPLRSQ